MSALLPTLPPLPERMRHLHVSPKGYPTPWFVAWLDDTGKPLPDGQGTPDFRIVGPNKIMIAVNERRCWICGGALSAFRSFVIGPMCVVNRVSSEPPSHLECADFSARACPFLANPKRERRDDDMPPKRAPAGVMIRRNPGVALVWTTKASGYAPFEAPGGVLFKLHKDPEHVRWYAEGRPATRAEVAESVETGYPALLDVCRDANETRLLGLSRVAAERLYPRA